MDITIVFGTMGNTFVQIFRPIVYRCTDLWFLTPLKGRGQITKGESIWFLCYRPHVNPPWRISGFSLYPEILYLTRGHDEKCMRNTMINSEHGLILVITYWKSKWNHEQDMSFAFIIVTCDWFSQIEITLIAFNRLSNLFVSDLHAFKSRFRVGRPSSVHVFFQQSEKP